MLQPIASGVSFILNLQSQSHWSLFNGTWQKRPRELDYRLRFENEEMTLQMQKAVFRIHIVHIFLRGDEITSACTPMHCLVSFVKTPCQNRALLQMKWLFCR